MRSDSRFGAHPMGPRSGSEPRRREPPRRRGSLLGSALVCILCLVCGQEAVAEKVAVLVSGTEYHHMADICTAALTIFANFDRTFLLMEQKPSSLKNFMGNEIANLCEPTHLPRGHNLKNIFQTSLTSADDVVLFLVGFGGYRMFTFPTLDHSSEQTADYRWKKVLHQSDWVLMLQRSSFNSLLVYADYQDAGSLFAVDGSVGKNVVAITCASNKATQCFQPDAPQVCKSSQFIQEVIRTHGRSLQAQVRSLAGSFGSDLLIHNKESPLFTQGLPWSEYTFGASLPVERNCYSTEVPLCYAYMQYGSDASKLAKAIAPVVVSRDFFDEKFIDLSNCNMFNVLDGEGSPIEGSFAQLECLRRLVSQEKLEVANAYKPWEYDACVRDGLNVVPICGKWDGYSTRFSKVIHILCGKNNWTKRRVVKALENTYGESCDTNEYPDHRSLAVILGAIGMIMSSCIVCFGKPLDKYLIQKKGTRQ